MRLPALPLLLGLLGWAPLAVALGAPDSASLRAAPPPPIDSTPKPSLFSSSPSPFAAASTAPSSPTPFAAGAASLVVPGLGQWWTGHPIRGSLLGALDLWLYGDALQRCLTGIPNLREERDAILVVTRSEESRLANDTTPDAVSRLKTLRDSLSKASGNANISTDYVHSEIAWATGVHLWGVVDAAESAWLRNGGKRPVRTMAQAAWASALVPGLGQILNGRYSKAALLYMAVAGATVSLDGRQGMVEFWKTEAALAASQGRSTTTQDEQADFFRKRRNQYIWGLGLIYVYQVLDATVDARLSRVETTMSLSLAPSFQGPGLVASLNF